MVDAFIHNYEYLASFITPYYLSGFLDRFYTIKMPERGLTDKTPTSLFHTIKELYSVDILSVQLSLLVMEI